MTARRITTDELGVVAFVLPQHANKTFDLHEWPDGSFSLELVDDAADELLELQHDHRFDAGLRSA
jgi:hypothetical protein